MPLLDSFRGSIVMAEKDRTIVVALIGGVSTLLGIYLTYVLNKPSTNVSQQTANISPPASPQTVTAPKQVVGPSSPKPAFIESSPASSADDAIRILGSSNPADPTPGASITLVPDPEPAPASKFNQLYIGRRFDVQMISCLATPIASCTVRVTAKASGPWGVTSANYFTSYKHGKIKASTIKDGDDLYMVADQGNVIQFDKGVSQDLTVNFDQSVDPADIQSLEMYVGHWTANVQGFQPIWK